MGFEAGLLDVIVRDEGFVLATYDTVLIEIRARPMQEQDLEVVARAGHELRARTGEQLGGFVGVLEDGAEMVASELRAKQTATMRGFLEDRRVHLASVVLGSGPRALVARTVLSLFGVGQPRMRTTSTIEEAADWLVERGVRVCPLELAGVVEHLRANRVAS